MCMCGWQRDGARREDVEGRMPGLVDEVHCDEEEEEDGL